MPIFKYKATNKEQKEVEGLIEANNDSIAAEILMERGLSVLSVQEEEIGSAHKGLSFLNRVKIKDLVIFSRQFSVMISANVAIVQSLKILIDQTQNMRLKMIVSQIADDVNSGSRLSDALAKEPGVFSNFYISVIRSGETSGRLDEALVYLADEMEKDYDMTSKIRGAMIYPAFVLTGLLVVGGVMMVFVVPKLTDVLTESGQELPITTKILIGISSFLAGYWWILLVSLAILFFGLKYYTKTPQGKLIFDTIILRLPIFGKLFQRIYLVRFARSMNTLIVGGVSITESLRIAADIASNEIYKDLILETVKEVEDGNSISSVFVNSKQIPQMVSQMLSIGEKTGKLDVILDRITNFYTREINNVVANLMTLMEPIIMVVMGLAVGVMVSAIIMPMYNMAQGV